MSFNMVQLSLLVFALLVVGNWAAPSLDELEEVYLDTCQSSCAVVSNNDEAHECREKFCSSYVTYLLTAVPPADASPSSASSHRKEVGQFCATWMVQLIQQLGWNTRIRLNLKECICAAGKDCFI